MSVTVHVPGLASERGTEEGLENLFAGAFHGCRTAMLVTDPHQPDNPVTHVNEAFCALTGYSREEVVGCNCRFLQGPETDAATIRSIREAVSAGEGIETEILNYRRDGTRFWNSLVISPVRNEAGELLYFFASQSDVSEKKRNEAELARIRNLVDDEVRRRTQDLQTALDQKAALLHEVDHRAKNSLQVISSLVLLKARRLQDVHAQGALHGLAERISALSTVHRLLYAGGDATQLSLSEFIGDLLADLVPPLPSGRLSLDVAADQAAVPAAKAVPLALLVNELVTNALKHAFPGDKTGRLSVRVTKPGSDLRVVIEDDGIGLGGGAPSDGGFGKTLIEMLVRQLRARIAWEDAAPGTRAVVTVPIETDEAPG